MQKVFKVALCQTKTMESKLSNIREAYKFAKMAKQVNPDVLLFGEYFTSLIMPNFLVDTAERVDDFKSTGLSKQLEETIAADLPIELEAIFEDILQSEIPAFLFLKALSYSMNLLVVGGSIVEKKEDRLFNSCFVFDRGQLLGKHQKVHLFDVDIPGKMTFTESNTSSVCRGESPRIASLERFRKGLDEARNHR